MAIDSTLGVCIVRATAEGSGVRFTILSTVDTAAEGTERRTECLDEHEAIDGVRQFLAEFLSRYGT